MTKPFEPCLMGWSHKTWKRVERLWGITNTSPN